MKAQVLVKSRVEDPEVREFRRNLVESKRFGDISFPDLFPQNLIGISSNDALSLAL